MENMIPFTSINRHSFPEQNVSQIVSRITLTLIVMPDFLYSIDIKTLLLRIPSRYIGQCRMADILFHRRRRE